MEPKEQKYIRYKLDETINGIISLEDRNMKKTVEYQVLLGEKILLQDLLRRSRQSDWEVKEDE